MVTAIMCLAGALSPADIMNGRQQPLYGAASSLQDHSVQWSHASRCRNQTWAVSGMYSYAGGADSCGVHLQALKDEEKEVAPAAEPEVAAPARTSSGMERSDSASAAPQGPFVEPTPLDAPSSPHPPLDDSAAAATAAAQITQKALQAGTLHDLTSCQIGCFQMILEHGSSCL